MHEAKREKDALILASSGNGSLDKLQKQIGLVSTKAWELYHS